MLQRRLREIFDKRQREQEEEERAQPASEAAGAASSEVNLAAQSRTLAPTQGESESEQEREPGEDDQPGEEAQTGPTGVAACRVPCREDTGMWKFSTEPRATNIYHHRLFLHCPCPLVAHTWPSRCRPHLPPVAPPQCPVPSVSVFPSLSPRQEPFDSGLADLLDARRNMLREEGLPEDAQWLPWRGQKRAQESLRAAWMESPAAQQIRERLLVQSSDARSRAMASYYRKHLKEVFVDAIWAHVLLVVGAIDSLTLEIVSDLYRERTLASTQGQVGPRQLPRRDRAEAKGPTRIMHKTSPAKTLRIVAGALDSQIREQED